MKLQLALDMTDIDQAIKLATTLQDQIDIIEIGSLLIYAHGTTAISRFRAALPKATILADLKIVDRGKEATQLALRAGADWVTVLAGTSKAVIHSTATSAHDLGKKVMLDLIDASSLGQSALEAASLGVDALLFHKPSDDADPHLSFLENWDMVRGNTKLPIFISAPVSHENLGTLMSFQPEGIVLGKSITESENPKEALDMVRTILNKI